MTAGALSLARLLRDFPDLGAAIRGADRAAATDAPVLILGEPGTGRSTLARAIHAASPRAAGPLVEVDPGAVPSALFESELFGYRAGAFTGAQSASEGRVARAQGGTLVLDHLEELPLAAQPKLLRLIAERRYAPLGGAETAADLRFVALSDDDLTSRVARGAFRADLFYRLEVVAFRLPPLRERPQDLPAILDELLADLAERFGRPGLALAPAARSWMLRHPWPGNLRQVRNVLERGLIFAGDGPLDPAPPEGVLAASSAAGGWVPREARPRSLVEVEREQILAALAYTRGHQAKAASLLGISRKSLWERRRRHGIP
ncbi:MAG TPA: sigma 54-interacting transcriptional regulator [Thermoanaerobaculia bacterium]|nr:sigma 54-interacting transcriptional regulator [Thermoanaerobaculia bacterium]